jgi:tRNA-splicing ligase RtcB (3'-phosphate/5'-hydroxy nucleic acid ligase)
MMNGRQLVKLGIPEGCVNLAITAIQSIGTSRRIRKSELRDLITRIVESPIEFLDDATWGGLATELVDEQNDQESATVRCDYRTWGMEDIDSACQAQMQQACTVPVARRAALMADAHVGYGLPIGGVLACKNAVIPYAVGVDIACRMKLSILDLDVDTIESKAGRYDDALNRGTRFGVGAEFATPQFHGVMDQDWTITSTTRGLKDRAWRQLGTSGSGNHFVEFGTVTLETAECELGLEAGQYVALLSHSGSRGTGAAVCNRYSNIARSKLPRKFSEFGFLAWLDLESEAGQEYWMAMQLMGEYAAANHDVIHKSVSKLVGARVISSIENHHNFAWLETHQGEELVVHRKGATPAGQGVLGVIPGTMADPAYLVRGTGNADSLCSASHGAGRKMSRRAARDTFRWNATKNDLLERGIRVLAADSDEVPGAYKDIHSVMREQSDLVETIGKFQPRVVKMCGDGSQAED